MDDNGTSYGITTDHREDQVTLPAVLPMIINGMIVSNPAMSCYSLSDYFAQSFLDTGIMDWLNGKTMSTDDINKAWLTQMDDGAVTIGEKTYPAPANMGEMFFKQEVPGMIWGTQTVAWAKLDKIFTPGFYNYFNGVPALAGDAYEDMRYAHPDGENDMYRIDDTFSDSDHLKTGSSFMTKLAIDFISCFEWIDAAPPTDVHTVQSSKFKVQSDNEWYDLLGRKLAGRPAKKGVYVHQGKKVVM